MTADPGPRASSGGPSPETAGPGDVPSDTSAPAPDTGVSARRAAALAALVFLVALNLRPAMTSVGPLLPQIGADEGLSEGLQGLLTSLPLLAFALFSPLVPRVSARLGVERTMLAALVVLAAGALIRSFTGSAGLWIGTLVLGTAIAVGNVLVPLLVKRDYPNRVSRAISISSACLSIGAASASAVAVPLANVIGWRGALAFWALPALLVALLWLPRARPKPAPPVPLAEDEHPPVTVWRQRMAWLVTAFVGVQSTIFFVLVTWLPTIAISAGASAEAAGLYLFAFQLIGILAGLSIPLLVRPDSQVLAAVSASVPTFLGITGLLLVPAWSPVWALVAGVGNGSSLVVAQTLISLRGRTHHETAQLSGMAQSVGFLLAAAGPVLAGYLADVTGGWTATLTLVAGLALVQIGVAFAVGRDREAASHL